MHCGRTPATQIEPTDKSARPLINTPRQHNRSRPNVAKRLAARPWVRGQRRCRPPRRATRGAARVPQSNVRSAISPGGVRRRGASGPPDHDLAPRPYHKRQARGAARVARRARCATGGVPEVVHRREAWEPFGAKNQYGPPDNATRPPAPHEGHARRRPAHATAHASCPRRERAHTTTSARQPTMAPWHPAQ